MKIKNLPVENAPAALNSPHLPTRLQAFVWRNWGYLKNKNVT